MAKTKQKPWSEAELETIRSRWSAGEQSATEIGRLLGRTKNSVLGMVFRMGVKRAPKPVVERPGPKRGERKRSRARKQPQRPERPTPKAAKKYDPFAMPTAPRERGKHYPAMEAAPPRSQCQWIYGEPSTPEAYYCGDPALTPHPYCRDHCDRAYRSNKFNDNVDETEMTDE